MSENNESGNDESTEAETTMTDIDPSDLSEDELAAILSNPSVKKSLRYNADSVQSVRDGLSELTGEGSEDERDDETEEAYQMLVSGIAERRGRVSESTVEKVLSGFVAEVDEVTE